MRVTIVRALLYLIGIAGVVLLIIGITTGS